MTLSFVTGGLRRFFGGPRPDERENEHTWRLSSLSTTGTGTPAETFDNISRSHQLPNNTSYGPEELLVDGKVDCVIECFQYGC